MNQLPGPGEPQNPWLTIPAEDYEGHMGSPQVGQLQMLNRLFKRVLDETRPESAAVLGCTTGNGFEHFDPAFTRYILGVDINPVYLEITRKRFDRWGQRLELICGDLHRDCFGGLQFDLVHAALVFEYVDAEIVLGHIIRALKPQGRFSVVLQMASRSLPAVSNTPYKSLENLAPVMHLYDAGEFNALAKRTGIEQTAGEVISLPGGKDFYYGVYA